MRKFSSADAKIHFGDLVHAARLAPVAVTKCDKPFVVVMLAGGCERLKVCKLDNLAPVKNAIDQLEQRRA